MDPLGVLVRTQKQRADQSRRIDQSSPSSITASKIARLAHRFGFGCHQKPVAVQQQELSNKNWRDSDLCETGKNGIHRKTMRQNMDGQDRQRALREQHNRGKKSIRQFQAKKIRSNSTIEPGMDDRHENQEGREQTQSRKESSPRESMEGGGKQRNRGEHDDSNHIMLVHGGKYHAIGHPEEQRTTSVDGAASEVGSGFRHDGVLALERLNRRSEIPSPTAPNSTINAPDNPDSDNPTRVDSPNREGIP